MPASTRLIRVKDKVCSLEGVPKLRISKRGRPPARFDPSYEYSFRYRAKRHSKLPHVMKFSGGRSSGLLLFSLLEGGLLDPARGDVIVFNNTAAEHPETYKFVATCKEIAEREYGIPFFWIEYQTYEDARAGNWTRIGTYRLTNSQPWSEDNPDGYHCNGEPFEEMLSLTGFVPNQFRRICTKTLKLECSRMFLRDWLACKESIPRLGHWLDESQIDIDALYARHLKHNGSVPKEIFAQKKEFLLSRPIVRPEQCYKDFTRANVDISNTQLEDHIFGGNADFGSHGIEYLSIIGLRGDEPMRVQRVFARADGGPEAKDHEGEIVYMPLASMKITVEDVNRFWKDKEWGLSLAAKDHLSNCVYCFLKGSANLATVHRKMQEPDSATPPDSPMNVLWWARIEKIYGRDLVAEKRKKTKKDSADFLGFFGSGSKVTYAKIADQGVQALDGNEMLPCDCTD